jgi:hypothetical protein
LISVVANSLSKRRKNGVTKSNAKAAGQDDQYGFCGVGQNEIARSAAVSPTTVSARPQVIVVAKIGPIVAEIIHAVLDVFRLVALTTGLVLALAAVT